MKIVQSNGLVYYRFNIFEPFERLGHGVFTSQGGYSRPPLGGLNLAFNVLEDERTTVANMDLVAGTLGFPALSFTGQVHGDQALVVRAEEGYYPRARSEVRRGFDALITPDAGLCLALKLADCQGILLFDPEKNVLALVHSGWRGSVKNVLGRTVGRLAADFGVSPADLRAGLSPSLGPCCAEFVNFRDELPESFWDYRKDNLFDFWAISRDQLVEAGLRPENIEISGLCTKCGHEGFYSHRRDKSPGRFGLAAGLSEEA
ncbi:MAG: polyphenol oxidase family protein [Thermodesulfobacteriota bacterium]